MASVANKTLTLEMDHTWEEDEADAIVIGSIIEIEWKCKVRVDIQILDVTITDPQIDYGDKGNTPNMVKWKDSRAAELAVRKYLNSRAGKERVIELLGERLAED